jgi:hypothetical protein
MASSVRHSSSVSIIREQIRQQDPEPKEATSHPSYFRLVFDQAGVDSAVLQHEYRGHGTKESPYIVDFLPNDPRNPLEFPTRKKWFFTILQAVATLAVTLASTAYTGGLPDVLASFHVSEEIGLLGVSLFVLGFAIGPLLWAPLSGTPCAVECAS